MQRYKKEKKTKLFIKLIFLLFLFHEAKNRHLQQYQVKNNKNKTVTDILIQVTVCISFTITNILQN